MTYKQRALSFIHWTYLAVLVWGTVLIILRRWAWDQVPTQVSAPVVYLTLLINMGWIALLIVRWAKKEA